MNCFYFQVFANRNQTDGPTFEVSSSSFERAFTLVLTCLAYEDFIPNGIKLSPVETGSDWVEFDNQVFVKTSKTPFPASLCNDPNCKLDHVYRLAEVDKKFAAASPANKPYGFMFVNPDEH